MKIPLTPFSMERYRWDHNGTAATQTDSLLLRSAADLPAPCQNQGPDPPYVQQTSDKASVFGKLVFYVAVRSWLLLMAKTMSLQVMCYSVQSKGVMCFFSPAHKRRRFLSQAQVGVQF